MTERTLILAKVLHVYDNVYYTACRMCYSKIHFEEQNPKATSSTQVCLKCGKGRKVSESIQRYRISLHITDGNSHCDVAVFGTQLEQFIGASAQYLHTYTQWMKANDVDPSVLNVALQHVFCDKWFLFGFKVQRCSTHRPTSLEDIITACPMSQTQSVASQRLTAWQMTPVTKGCVTQLPVITLLKHLVHGIIEKRDRLAGVENHCISVQRTHNSFTDTSDSTTSFLLCEMNQSAECSASVTRPQPSSHRGGGISHESRRGTPCGALSREDADSTDAATAQALRSEVSRGKDKNCTTNNPCIRPYFTNSTHESGRQNNFSHDDTTCSVSDIIDKGVLEFQLSMEVPRAGTQEAVNSVLLELETLDFSGSFSEKYAVSAGSDTTMDHAPTRRRSAYSQSRVSQAPSLDITQEAGNADVAANARADNLEENEEDEYYNLRGGGDETIDVMRDFRKACRATQMPLCAMKQSGSDSSVILPARLTLQGSGELPGTPSDCQAGECEMSCDGLEDSFNESSLLLCCGGKADEDADGGGGKADEDADGGGGKADEDADGGGDQGTVNDSSLLLLRATEGTPQAYSVAEMNVNAGVVSSNCGVSGTSSNSVKISHRDENESCTEERVGISEESMHCPDSTEDLAPFLNSSKIETAAIGASRSDWVLGKVENTSGSRVKITNDLESCPYSEDLAAFLNDTENAAGFGMLTTEHFQDKPQKELDETVASVNASVCFEYINDNDGNINIQSFEQHNFSGMEKFDVDLPESEDLSKFLQNLDNHSMAASAITEVNNSVTAPVVKTSQGHVCSEGQRKGEIVSNGQEGNEESVTKKGIHLSKTTAGPEADVAADEVRNQRARSVERGTNGAEVCSANIGKEEVTSTACSEVTETSINLTHKLEVLHCKSSQVQKDNEASMRNVSCCSNLSEDLFGESFKENELSPVSGTVDGNDGVGSTGKAGDNQRSGRIPPTKSVCFARKLFQQELISEIDYQMQTTPVSFPNAFRRQSCLKRSKSLVVPLADITNAQKDSASPLPYSEELFTPSPIGSAKSDLRKSCLFQSTPLVSDASSPSLFSSPENSILHRSNVTPHKRHCRSICGREQSGKKPRGEHSEGDSSLFSNESLFSEQGDNSLVKIDSSSKENKSLSDFINDSDFIPPSCSRTVGTSRKIIL